MLVTANSQTEMGKRGLEATPLVGRCTECKELYCYIVTSTHTGWWRTIKEVEPTGEGTHNPEHNRSSGSPQSQLQPYHPTLQRLHHGLWVLLGVHVLEILTQCTHAMHICTMNMHYTRICRYTHAPSENVHTCIGATYMMNNAHPGPGSENWFSSSLDHTAFRLLKGVSSALPVYVVDYS